MDGEKTTRSGYSILYGLSPRAFRTVINSVSQSVQRTVYVHILYLYMFI